MGRTHGIHAEPTTFGLKLAGWGFALDRDRERVSAGDRGPQGGQALRRGRDVCDDRPGGRARRARSRSVSSPLRRRRRSSSATVTPRSCPRSLSSASSLDRFATEIRHLARTEVREVEEPFAAGRRARRRCPTSATRSPPSGSAGWRGSCAPTRSSGSRTSRCGTSGTSRTRPPSAWCFPTRFSPSTTCSTASRGSSTGSSSGRSGCARTSRQVTACTTANGCCSRSSSRVSVVTRRTGWCSVTRCARGTRRSTFRSSFVPTPSSPGGSTSTPCSTTRRTPVRRMS